MQDHIIIYKKECRRRIYVDKKATRCTKCHGIVRRIYVDYIWNWFSLLYTCIYSIRLKTKQSLDLYNEYFSRWFVLIHVIHSIPLGLRIWHYCKTNSIWHKLFTPYSHKLNPNNSIRLRLGISISFQILDSNYKIINKEFENDKVWKIILKSSSLTTFITMID